MESSGIPEDGNPLLGFVPGHQNGKVVLTQIETNLPPLEGLSAPPINIKIPPRFANTSHQSPN